MESNSHVRLRILPDVAILAAEFACMDPIRRTAISTGLYRDAALPTDTLTEACGF
jgi:hypothetical protein